MGFEIIIILCLVGLLAFGLCMAMFRSMLKAAICLACSSAILAIIMFVMGATWAGVFELSVCSGLITVIFISAITVTKEKKEETEEIEKKNKENVRWLPWLIIIVAIVVIAILVVSHFSLEPNDVIQETGTFSEILWNTRQADLLGLIFVVLTGAFAIVVLFKERRKK